MVQVLKDKIKNNILVSAKKIFVENGFQKTTMETIAKKADISVGNLYRYFKNKKELFEELMSAPVAKKLITTLKSKFAKAAGRPLGKSKDFYQQNKELIDFLVLNREELIILFIGSRGTDLEFYTEGLANSLAALADQYKKSVKGSNPPLSPVRKKIIIQIYESFINNIITVMIFNKDTPSISEGLQAIFDYHFFGIGKLVLPKN